MTDQNGRVHLDLSDDPRLLAGLGSAVETFAHLTGLPDAASHDLMLASEEVCRDTFPLLSGAAPTLGVTLQSYPDRVEVTLEHRGEALPSAGLDTFFSSGAAAAEPGQLTGLALLARVDRVQYHTEGGVSRTTLIKYLKGSD